jgi:hypothetical protein
MDEASREQTFVSFSSLVVKMLNSYNDKKNLLTQYLGFALTNYTEAFKVKKEGLFSPSLLKNISDTFFEFSRYPEFGTMF